MHTRIFGAILLLLMETCIGRPTDHAPAFVFYGKQLYIGMPKRDLVEALSACCKLSPPVEVGANTDTLVNGKLGGHFIISREAPPQILGSIYFSGDKIVRIERPLAGEVDSHDDNVVAFARALKRALPPEASSELGTTAVVSVRHEQATNAESDVVTFSFPNGRGVVLRIGTLDKPFETNNKRDFVNLDETLEPAVPK